MEIHYRNNFLSNHEHQYVYDYCLNASYTYGEKDGTSTPETGMVHNISEDREIYSLFRNRIEQSDSGLVNRKLYRMYVNCFAPTENPYFHIDGQGVTLLYYPQLEWDLNDGGETQFYVDGNIYGITPEPNRIVIFDASILHRATTFRNKHRFTVAIKYE